MNTVKVQIEFELEVGEKFPPSALDDLISDWTYEMRVSRFLVPGSWRIDYR